jgi:putative hydrolase of the HAD superfamily
MVQNRGVIFWDFDGTLVRFTSWRFALMDVLNECDPGHNIDPEQIRPFLRDGFPWHKPEEPHLHLCNPDDWWKALEPLFLRCYKGVGYMDERAAELARQVRKQMITPERYTLYDDAVSVLVDLKERGWRHMILSNHIPELPDVVKVLGLFRYVDFCIVSAATGYEKPNPQAFFNALSLTGDPRRIWMVGDNIVSDVRGAENAGIPAILVHTQPIEPVKYFAATLSDVLDIIEDNPDTLSS